MKRRTFIQTVAGATAALALPATRLQVPEAEGLNEMNGPRMLMTVKPDLPPRKTLTYMDAYDFPPVDDARMLREFARFEMRMHEHRSRYARIIGLGEPPDHAL